MEPVVRFRRSLFGYSPKRVQAYIAAQPEPEPPGPTRQELEDDLRALEDELDAARTELAEQAAALRSAEATSREAQGHARRSDLRAAGLEADLRRTTERSERRDDDLRAVEEQAQGLTSKLGVLREALTAEIGKVWAAETRVHELGGELEATRRTLHVAEHELEVQRNRADEAETRAQETERDAPRHSDARRADALEPVFDVAERTIAGIIAEARSRGEAELREVQEEIVRLLAESRDLESWLGRVEPLVIPLQRSVLQAQVEAERVGGLIRRALGPLTSAVAVLAERLADLADLAAVSGPAEGESTGDAPEGGTGETAAPRPRQVVDITGEPADTAPR